MILDSNSASGVYEIDNSLKLEQDNTEYLHKTPTSSGNRRTFTLSAWIKRTEVNRGSGGGDYIFQAGDGDYNQSDRTLLKFNHDDTIYWGGGSAYEIKTNRVFRDTSAWYHIAMIVDTTSGTAGDRLKLYVNGVRETDLATDTNPSQNFQYAFMKDDKHTIGYNHTDSSNPASMYITEVVWLDGTAASITDLGKFDDDTGIWTPIDVSGLSVGTNGCYLDFEDSSTLGNDASGGTDFTLNNITAADQATDVPTNNFCTFNPRIATSNAPTINEGAMHVAGGGGTWNNAYGSLGAQNGKWYYEYKVTSTEFGFFGASTFPNEADASSSSQFMYDQSFSIGYAAAHYYQRINGSQISNEGTGWGTTSTNDIYGLFLNLDDQEFTVARNGSVLSGTLSQPVSLNSAFDNKFVFPCNAQYEDDGGEFNFGGYTLISNTKSYSDANGYGNFVYSPVLSSVNYYALCTKNLAEYG